MFQQVVFDTKQVVLRWLGDEAGCRLTASEPAWQPFADVVTALFARGVTTPVALDGVKVDGVRVALAEEEEASPALRRFWEEHLGWEGPPLRYWSFLRGQSTEGALMPDGAIWHWLAEARYGFGEWKKAHALATWWTSRGRAAQTVVDCLERSIDWSERRPVDRAAPARSGSGEAHPTVLAALEARMANFDELHPREPVTHVIRESVLSALAASGVLDPPDDDRRAGALEDCPRLWAWRRAALDWYEAADELPALRPAGCTHPLASPVALDWFRLGPFAGEDHAPIDWLRWHLSSWMEQQRTEPGQYDVFARALSARITWQTGVAGLQQLRSAGHPEAEVSWPGRCAARAAQCTRANHPIPGTLLAALLAAREPANWHGWMELGVALAGLAASGDGAELPFALRGEPFDRSHAAGSARAALQHAVRLHPVLRGASILQEVESRLEDHRLFRSMPPVPLEQLPAALLDGVDVGRGREAFRALPTGLRRYVAAGGFLLGLEPEALFQAA